MVWIALLAMPLAASFTKLGSALSMVSMLTIALQATGVVCLLLLAAVIWSQVQLHRSVTR
jgi:hypothetical protein